MNLFTSLMSISLGAILVNNFILAQFLGICPFMGVSQKTGTAMGMGLAVTFVMGIASAVTWAVNTYILIPLDLGYMQTVAFILVIAALVSPPWCSSWKCSCRRPCPPCIRPWASICPSSPPTARCWAWPC